MESIVEVTGNIEHGKLRIRLFGKNLARCACEIGLLLRPEITTVYVVYITIAAGACSQILFQFTQSDSKQPALKMPRLVGSLNPILLELTALLIPEILVLKP